MVFFKKNQGVSVTKSTFVLLYINRQSYGNGESQI